MLWMIPARKQTQIIQQTTPTLPGRFSWGGMDLMRAMAIPSRGTGPTGGRDCASGRDFSGKFRRRDTEAVERLITAAGACSMLWLLSLFS
jgi:hypothetical protein